MISYLYGVKIQRNLTENPVNSSEFSPRIVLSLVESFSKHIKSLEETEVKSYEILRGILRRL